MPHVLTDRRIQQLHRRFKVEFARSGWSRWADATRAIARDDFIRAADVCEMIGSLPDEALCRLRAAERLADDGQQSEADEQLGRALAFYRSVGATRFIRKAEALLAV